MDKHVHFMGISGSGASAVASIAQSQGFSVTGCSDKDVKNEFTLNFEDSQLFEGHSPEHLEGVDILAITPAILSWDPKNAELERAREKGIEVLTWQEFMGKYLTKNKFVIAVCGTHGKSTTTAMAGKLLEDAGLDPSVELGAIIQQWQTNFRVGRSKFFVVEADEYNNNFFAVVPDIAIVTSIEMDHPEFFKDFNEYKESFYKFLISTKQTIIANISDSAVALVVKDLMKHSSVKCVDYSKNEINFPLKVIGDFNKLNASSIFQLGLILNIDPAIIQKSLLGFLGISKRFEKLGEFNGAEVYTDFAHHPTEIEVTSQAIRKKFPSKKITLVFQPHMFSRTKALLDSFVSVFKNTPFNECFIVDIYHSREEDKGLINSQELVRAINKTRVKYAPSFERLEKSLRESIKSGEVLVFMGAGIVDQIGKKLVL